MQKFIYLTAIPLAFGFLFMSISIWCWLYIKTIKFKQTKENYTLEEKQASIFGLYLNKSNYKKVFNSNNNLFIVFIKGFRNKLTLEEQNKLKSDFIKNGQINSIKSFFVVFCKLIIEIFLQILFYVPVFLFGIPLLILLFPSLFLIYILVKLFAWDINKEIYKM